MNKMLWLKMFVCKKENFILCVVFKSLSGEFSGMICSLYDFLFILFLRLCMDYILDIVKCESKWISIFAFCMRF